MSIQIKSDMWKNIQNIASWFFLVMAAFLNTHCTLYAQKAPLKSPNIIYIYADDLGYGELGCYGQQKIRTPHIDKMAAQGIRFTQHYSGAPVCAPSRAILLTGKHSGHSYIRGNHELGGFPDSSERGQMPLSSKEITIAELLKQKGYTSAIIGKWGLGMHYSEGNPNNQGFDYSYGFLDQKQAHNYYPTHLWENGIWDSLHQSYLDVHKKLNPNLVTDSIYDSFKGKTYAPDKMTSKALQFIDQKKSGPFFLYLPYTLPHVSLQVPDDYIEKYKGLFDEKPYFGDKGYVPTRYPLSTYAAMITYLDDQVGKIMQKIQDVGLDENTIIFFSSDNGATFAGGADPIFFKSVASLRGLKMDLYEGGIRVPLIARWPGKIKSGIVSDHISAQYDMFATIAELTGININKTDGISLLPTLLSKKQKVHSYLYFEYPEKGGQLAIRMGGWKAIKTDLKKNPGALWELYNLKTDISETINLASKHPEIIKKVVSIVKKEHQKSHLDDWEFVEKANMSNK